MRARNYRSIRGQLYTRREYVHGAPQPKITKFAMGEERQDYDVEVSLIAKENVLIRDRALEAVRITTNKNLSKNVGSGQYFLRILVYPHHVLRENKMMTGAGADRLQEGMRRAFGRAVGRAAAVRKGQPILIVRSYCKNLELIIKALRVAGAKIPKGAKITVKRM